MNNHLTPWSDTEHDAHATQQATKRARSCLCYAATKGPNAVPIGIPWPLYTLHSQDACKTGPKRAKAAQAKEKVRHQFKRLEQATTVTDGRWHAASDAALSPVRPPLHSGSRLTASYVVALHHTLAGATGSSARCIDSSAYLLIDSCPHTLSATPGAAFSHGRKDPCFRRGIAFPSSRLSTPSSANARDADCHVQVTCPSSSQRGVPPE
jgi:hypothetical protein